MRFASAIACSSGWAEPTLMRCEASAPRPEHEAAAIGVAVKRAPLALALVLASLVARAAAAQETPPALVSPSAASHHRLGRRPLRDFYVRVLDFRREVEIEVAGDPYQRLSGVFGVRTRTARAAGEECLDLTEYVAPRGRPAPADSRSNDRWFQHVAIVVADMDRAYQRLRAARVEHVSSGPQRLPDWNPEAGGMGLIPPRRQVHYAINAASAALSYSAGLL
jgi:hypothetical protein